MLTNELVRELNQLSHAEKLRVVQMLVNELAASEDVFAAAPQYEVWSPYNSADAAAALTDLLKEDQQSQHG